MSRRASRCKIPAEVFTRDGARRAQFEVSEWFAAACAEQIVELAQNDWRVTSAGGTLEQYAFGSSEAVADVLAYVMYLRHGGLAGERSYVVDAGAAVRWLAARRPAILTQLGRVQRDGVEGGRRKSATSGTPKIKTNGKRKTRPLEAA